MNTILASSLYIIHGRPRAASTCFMYVHLGDTIYHFLVYMRTTQTRSKTHEARLRVSLHIFCFSLGPNPMAVYIYIHIWCPNFRSKRFNYIDGPPSHHGSMDYESYSTIIACPFCFVSGCYEVPDEPQHALLQLCENLAVLSRSKTHSYITSETCET